eukprot:1366532-Rhodomonas_salina.1
MRFLVFDFGLDRTLRLRASAASQSTHPDSAPLHRDSVSQPMREPPLLAPAGFTLQGLVWPCARAQAWRATEGGNGKSSTRLVG